MHSGVLESRSGLKRLLRQALVCQMVAKVATMKMTKIIMHGDGGDDVQDHDVCMLCECAFVYGYGW